jgi:hypothetical protein
MQTEWMKTAENGMKLQPLRARNQSMTTETLKEDSEASTDINLPNS